MRIQSTYDSAGNLPTRIVLRQLDVSGGHAVGGGTPAVVASNQTYLLFLRNFEFVRGQALPDEYSALGCGQAIYVAKGADFVAEGPAETVPIMIPSSALGLPK